MKELSLNLVLGVTSGLFTALLVLIIRGLWIKVLVPWFEELVYKDAKIEGQWFGYSETVEYSLTIERVGHKIRGQMTALTEIDKGRTWTVEGTFRNLILTAVYGATERTRIDRGGIVLMLEADGEVMSGQLAYYLGPKHAVKSSTFQICRKKKASIA
jgi:hypothetical protein